MAEADAMAMSHDTIMSLSQDAVTSSPFQSPRAHGTPGRACMSPVPGFGLPAGRCASGEKKRKSGSWDAEEELMESLTCIVCMGTMPDAIFQCPEGHLVCEACKPRLLGKCPTCRMSMGNIRNRALERLAGLMKLPCKFCDSGCPAKMSAFTRKTHQSTCTYRPIACPLSASCSFSGTRDQLLDHLRGEHHVSRRSELSSIDLQSPASFLESSSALGVIFTAPAPAGEAAPPVDLMFVWTQTVHYLQACVVSFGGEGTHRYTLRIAGRGRAMEWSAPTRGIRGGASPAFCANDCLNVPQSLAGWFSDTPADSDELNLKIDIEISPIDSAAGPMEMPPFTPLSTAPPRPARQSVLAARAEPFRVANSELRAAPRAAASMAASMVAAAAAAAARRPAPSPRLIRGGSISREMRNWLSQRGGWGRVELEVCEIIGSTRSDYGSSFEEVLEALGQRHESHTLRDAVAGLLTEGWIHHTVDEHHYRLTDDNGQGVYT